MIFSADDLLEELTARASGALPTTFDRQALVDAVAQADKLAGGAAGDEPAALFFALARRSRSFGELAAEFVPDMARFCAAAHGLELVAGVELDVYRLRVLLRQMRFDELRADFAARLRPLP